MPSQLLAQKKAVAPVQKKAPVQTREEEDEPEKIAPVLVPVAKPSARVLPQKSSSAIPSQAAGAKPRIQEASPPASPSSPKVRILPGGVKAGGTPHLRERPPAPKTYITPVRIHAVEKPPEENGEEEEKAEAETEEPAEQPTPLQKKPPAQQPAKITPLPRRKKRQQKKSSPARISSNRKS